MTPGNRPKDLHTKHLTERERFRVRTLYYDACMSKKRIQEITGYSNSQIRTAIRAKSAAVPPRTGRPKKVRDGEPSASTDQPQQPEGDNAAATPSHAIALPSEIGAGADSSYVSTPGSSYAPLDLLPLSSASGDSTPNLPGKEQQQQWQQQWQQQQQQQQQLRPQALAPPPSSAGAATTAATTAARARARPHPRSHPSAQQNHHLLVAYRQATAHLLCNLSRQARRVVLDTLTPVWSQSGHRMLGSALPFLWVDPYRDTLYRKDGSSSSSAADLPALLDRSRIAILPRLGAPHLPVGVAEAE
ncbi:hypothetical protein AAE478_010118 [Parahypoxylon ruwenzoriense]